MRDGEAVERIADGRVVVVEFDDERVFAHVRGQALHLEGLEACPAEQRLVGRRELAEVLREVLVRIPRAGLLRGGDGALGVLADSAVPKPVVLLAIGRLRKAQ